MNSPSRTLVPLAALALVGYILFQVHHILLPFVLAAAVSYLLHPVIRLFEVRGLKHQPVALTLFVVLMALYFSAIYLTISLAAKEAGRVASDMPTYVQRMQAALKGDTTIQKRFPMLGNLKMDDWLNERLKKSTEAGATQLMTLTPLLAGHIFPFFELLLLVPFLTLFFMLDGPRVAEALFALVPSCSVETVLHLVVQMDNSLGNYVRGMILQSLFMGLAAGIGFRLIGLHYYLQISLWVAATSTVPLVGPFSAALAGVVVALFQWGTMGGLVRVLIVFLGIRLLDDWFVHPFIVRRAVHIHPVLTVFSMMAGATLAGFWGLIFAVPVVSMIKVLSEVIWEWYRWESPRGHSRHITDPPALIYAIRA